jgi:hypothetical protein
MVGIYGTNSRIDSQPENNNQTMIEMIRVCFINTNHIQYFYSLLFSPIFMRML